MQPKLIGITAALLGASLSAQSRADYLLSPVTKTGGQLLSVHTGMPQAPFAHFVDAVGGRYALGAETLWLGLSPAFTILDAGAMPNDGRRLLQLGIPSNPALHGLTLYGQIALFTNGAPAGFTLSGPGSTVLSSGSSFVAETFAQPVRDGLTGDFDKSTSGYLSPMPVTYNETRLLDSIRQGTAFSQALTGPFGAHGVRHQWVVRTSELRAGVDNALVGVAWRPFGSQVNGTTTFNRFVLDVSHSRVVPDYSVGQFSALPLYPASGLDETNFANNVKSNEQPLRVVDGAYTVRPNDLRQDGYLPFPAMNEQFLYNGFDSLLLDFYVPPQPQLTVTTGMSIWLPILSSPDPHSRAFSAGTSAQPIDPFRTTSGQGDNALPDFKFRFAKVVSRANSRIYTAPNLNPDWMQPVVTASLPQGTSVRVEFQGYTSPTGTNPTGWINRESVDFNLDGYRYVAFRVTMIANGLTGALPALHSVVMPIR